MGHCVECLHRSKGKKCVEALPGRLWCAACAPENRETVVASPEFRHGYYVPALSQEFGDATLSAEARALWNQHMPPEPSSHSTQCKDAYPSGVVHPPIAWDKASGFACGACGAALEAKPRKVDPPSRYDTVSVYSTSDGGGIIRRMVRVWAPASGDASGKPAVVVTDL
jgi:hypothetical protein